jgi:hypothetical protein
MNAVADPVDTRRRDPQAVPGRELSWINAMFREWGVWIWDHRHFEGFPTADSVASFIQGRGGTSPGHRVLCRDMKPWILFAHVIWIMLPDHEALCVWAEFVPSVEDDGSTWTQEQKAAKLSITHDAYRCRLNSARVRVWNWSKQEPKSKIWEWSRPRRN